MANKPTQVTIGKNVRFCYLRVFDGETATDAKGEEYTKYSACLIIPKTAEKSLARIDAAIKAAIQEGADKLKNPKTGKIPQDIKTPLRDGDISREDAPEFANSYFINCSTRIRPTILDENGDEIIDKEDFYSGCYGCASINFYAFNTEGNKGIACSLNALKKCADGERLAGDFDAEAAFSNEETDDLD